jgi:hypothetical protein
MKRKLLLTACIISSALLSQAQNNKAYAITGNGTGDFQWMNIRQIDLNTGVSSKSIFEKGITGFQMFDAASGKELQVMQDAKQITNDYPTATMVAAAAYDKKHDKLFFTPMTINSLRWLDLSSGKDKPVFYSLQSPLLHPGNANDESNHFTRMTIGADGNGYALSNDGNHLIRFSTGKKVVLTDLGSLVDASTNNNISVHNKCSSWGGDMVADAVGNLYLVTASKNVFSINIENRIATHLGSITGLSGQYTVNGAAVSDDEHIVISSANTFEGFYKVSIKELTAEKLNTQGQVFNASDLAGGNLLFESQAKNTLGAAPLVQRDVIGNQFISIYPNPVFGNQFKVTFDNKALGQYYITLTDIQGKVIMTKPVYVKVAGQVESIQLNNHRANGMYLIKVTNSAKKAVYADKIVFD